MLYRIEMKKIISLGIGVLCLIIALPGIVQYLEEPYSYFPIYNKGVHTGGWVPDIFPSDITEIHEQHNIDTNEVWLRFKVGLSPIGLESYTPVASNEGKNESFSAPFLATWWPDALVNHFQAEKGKPEFVIYRGTCGQDKTAYFALQESSATAFWWCQYE